MQSKTVSTSIIWQLIGKIFLGLVSFLTMPIFTRILSPEDYGYISLYGAWCAIFPIIIGLQVGGSIGNARIKYDEGEIGKYLSSITSIALLTFAFVLCIFLIFHRFFSVLLGLRDDLIILLVIQGFSSFLIGFQVLKFDHFKQAKYSSIFTFCSGFFTTLISIIVLLLSRSNKAILQIYTCAIVNIIFGAGVLFFIYYKGRCLWNWEYIKFCIPISLPLVFHGLAGVVFNQTDKIMLQKMIGESELGMYSVSFSFCNILNSIYMVFNFSWLPFYYDYKKNGDEKQIIQRSKRYIRLFTFICIGFLLLYSDVFNFCINKTYYEGKNLIVLFVLGWYFNYLYLFPVNFEFYHCKTKMIPIGTVLSALINILANYFLIPKYGIMGAAIGTLLSRFILFIFHWIIANYFVGEIFEYKISMFFYNILIIVGMCVLVPFIDNYFFIRWILALGIGIYLLIDIIKNRSIF